jgi:DNA-binding CsgD family transcriptional regulator
VTGKRPGTLRLDRTSADLLVAIVHSVYQTLRDEGRWPTLLRQIQTLLRADACNLSLYQFHTEGGLIAVHSGAFDDQYVDRYRTHSSHHNPWFEREPYHRINDTVWLGTELVPMEKLQTTPFYRDWMRPQGLLHHCSATLFREDDTVACIELYRANGRPAFQREDLGPLQRLAPHIRQALEIKRDLAGLGAASTLVGIVGRLGQSPVVKDAQRRLYRGTADERDGAADQLTDDLDDNTPEIEAAESDRNSAMATVTPDSYRPAIAFSQPLDNEHIKAEAKRRRRWLPLVLPGEKGVRIRARPPAAIPVQAEDGLDDTNEVLLRRLFDLTRSESRVAELLAAGRSVPDVARQLGVGINTVRTHLQRVYLKTGSHHQGELVALLLSGSVGIRVAFHGSEAADNDNAADSAR